MMDFTQDERNMMMLYSPGTDEGTAFGGRVRAFCFGRLGSP